VPGLTPMLSTCTHGRLANEKLRVSTYLYNRPGRIEFGIEQCTAITTLTNHLQELETNTSAMMWQS
jgi:hypothetical protein